MEIEVVVSKGSRHSHYAWMDRKRPCLVFIWRDMVKIFHPWDLMWAFKAWAGRCEKSGLINPFS